MKRQYNKLKKIVDEIMINSLFKPGGTISESEAVKEAIYIHEVKKDYFELCFLNKALTEKDYLSISVFLNSHNELIFSYGYNCYDKMYYQHKMDREPQKTILLLDYIFKNCKDDIFKSRVLNYIQFSESEEVKNKFINNLN
jgi:hypothetical protein